MGILLEVILYCHFISRGGRNDPAKRNVHNEAGLRIRPANFSVTVGFPQTRCTFGRSRHKLLAAGFKVDLPNWLGMPSKL
jgi:hypothetical protein